MQRGAGGDVRSPCVLDAHLHAKVEAQVAGPPHLAEAAELGEFQRHRVHAAKLPAPDQRGGVVPVLVDLHGEAGGIAHGGAFLEGRARLFQHDVEIGNGAADPRRVQPRCPAIPVAIDQRSGRHRLAHLAQPRDVGLIVPVGAELDLDLGDAAACLLGGDARHFVRRET